MSANGIPGQVDIEVVCAVLLVGGRGTRLLPYTATFPKALMPLGDRPILEVLLRRLAAAGITHVKLATGHLAELIRAYFGGGIHAIAGLDIAYVQEQEPLGTAGALSLMSDLDHTFLVLNGDVLTDLDFRDLLEFHRAQGAALTIATHRREVAIDFGVLEIGADAAVTDYIEKPSLGYDVSMGVYVFEPSVLGHMEKGVHLEFPDLVLRLIEREERVVAYRSSSMWLDIGRPDDYAAAQALISENPDAFAR